MLNVSILQGRLCADPELKHTQNNVAVASFAIAVERSYVKSGEERQADFIDIVAWRNTAEFVCKYFRKGQMIAVQGSIQTRTYTDKDGNKRKAVEVIADNVHFADSKRSTDEAQPQQAQQTSSPPPQPCTSGTQASYSEVAINNDDLPF